MRARFEMRHVINSFSELEASSLGDLMTMAIQPRHTKLGLAGQERNWPYAQYELSELRNAFARVARTIPINRKIDMEAVFGSLTTDCHSGPGP